MKIKYFEDTDTAFLEFSEHPVFETKEINENISIPPFGDIAKIAKGLDPENTKRITL